MKGLFITFEGGEGSGKTTVVNGLKERLLKDGYKVVTTREPGGCPIAEDIREFIMNTPNLTNSAEAALYAAARAQHCNDLIRPALEENAIVLCDRYIHSNMVYQGYTVSGKDGITMIDLLNLDLKVIYPDMTFFLDVKPEEGLKRIQKNGREINRFDLKGLEFHQKVYDGYQELLNIDEMIRVDASKSNSEDVIDKIYAQIVEEIEKG